MKFDFKITTWERVTVREENEQEVLQAIKEGKIESAQDIFDFLADKGDMNIECEKLKFNQIEPIYVRYPTG